MAQANKVCPYCKKVGHSGFYCPDKPQKPIKQTAIKKPTVRRALRITKEEFSKEDKKVFNKAKNKKETRAGVVRRLDKVFSFYIRLRGSVEYDGEKMAICVTCKSMKRWQDQQNGHFFTRGRQSTRWDEMNCNVQCMRCNVFLKGNYINYTYYMIDTYGREAVDDLERKSLKSIKIPSTKLKEMIEYYSGQVDLLLK